MVPLLLAFALPACDSPVDITVSSYSDVVGTLDVSLVAQAENVSSGEVTSLVGCNYDDMHLAGGSEECIFTVPSVYRDAAYDINVSVDVSATYDDEAYTGSMDCLLVLQGMQNPPSYSGGISVAYYVGSDTLDISGGSGYKEGGPFMDCDEPEIAE